MVSLLVSALRCSMSGGEILARACLVPPAGRHKLAKKRWPCMPMDDDGFLVFCDRSVTARDKGTIFNPQTATVDL